jgi:hypothetical protein
MTKGTPKAAPSGERGGALTRRVAMMQAEGWHGLMMIRMLAADIGDIRQFLARSC